ncbi:P27 family phage terminase small subunit [Erysipelotrichaceae bacterium OttesenSCG-928-M19]|nr:P27 family phage terminase small subunit [Erysipelotrichaceae bacterium OttesenSCG-928-M19]
MAKINEIDFDKKRKDLERQYRFIHKQVKNLSKKIEEEGTTVISISNGIVQNPNIKTYNDMLKHLLSINRQLIELKDLLNLDEKDGMSELE